MRRFYTMLLLLLFMITGQVWRCSTNLAGGGSESGNPIIIGTIIDENGCPVSNARIMALRPEYNPVIDGFIADSLIDTTDASGAYCLTVSDSVTYNIQAVHLYEKTGLLITDVFVAHDTMFLKPYTLKQPGRIQLFLPDSVDTGRGYVYVKGTTVAGYLSKATPVSEGGYVLLLDSVPEATIPCIYYGKTGDPQKQVRMADTVEVVSGKTSAADAFVFRVLYTKDNSSMPVNSINDLYIDAGGIVWAGTHGGGVARYDGSGWLVYDNLNSGLVSNIVFDVYRTNDTMFFATATCLEIFYNSDKWEQYIILPVDTFSQICSDGNNFLWLIARRGGMMKKRDSVIVWYKTGNSNIPSDRVAFLTVDTANNVWCATDSGAAKFDGNSTWEVFNTGNSGILSNTVLRVLPASNGAVWFGHSEGVSRLHNSTWTTFTAANSSLLGTGVSALYEDKNGHVWFGTGIGLTRFDGTQWVDYTGSRYAYLENTDVRAIAQDAAGNTWVATGNRGIIAFGPTVN